METAILHSLTARRRAIAERQRLAGVSLADWIQFNSKGCNNAETTARIQKYIAVEVERIVSCTQQLLDIDAQIEEKTKGMSAHMKEILITQGIIF